MCVFDLLSLSLYSALVWVCLHLKTTTTTATMATTTTTTTTMTGKKTYSPHTTHTTNIYIYISYFVCAGLGYCTLVVITFVTIYYMVVIAWIIFYFFASFYPEIGWGYCHNDFNTDSKYHYHIYWLTFFFF